MANETTTPQNAGTIAAPAGQSATSDLDRLLAEHDAGKTQTTSPDYATVKPLIDAMKPVAQYAEGKMREEQNAAIAKSVSDAVSFVKSDETLKPISDKLVKGFLQDRYSEDASFKGAYDNRSKDPKAWDAALQSAQKDFKTEVQTLNGQSLRSDVEAATAAVRGAGRQPSNDGAKATPGKLRKMSDAEFAEFKAEEAARLRSA